MFHASKIDQSHIPLIPVNNSLHNQKGGVGGVYQASAVLKVCMTTRDDWIIKVSICGFCAEFRLLIFGDSSEDDVVSRMKRNETTIEKGCRTLVDAECAEIRNYSTSCQSIIRRRRTGHERRT